MASAVFTGSRVSKTRPAMPWPFGRRHGPSLRQPRCVLWMRRSPVAASGSEMEHAAQRITSCAPCRMFASSVSKSEDALSEAATPRSVSTSKPWFFALESGGAVVTF
jgi:hypothetical protein